MTKWWHFIKKQKQIQDFSIYGFGQFFNLVTPLLVAPYVIDICGEANYGKIAVGMSLAFFLIVFIDFGADISGVREVSVNRNNPKKLAKILGSTYLFRLFSMLSILVISSILFSTIPYFIKEELLFFMSLSIVVAHFFNPIWFLQGLEQIKAITIINIVSKVIYLVAVFVFIHKPEDYVLVNLFWGLGMILVNFVALLWVFNRYKSFGFQFSKEQLSNKFKTDFSIFGSQIFVSLQMYAPVFLLSILGSNSLAGQYKIVEQVINVFKTYILIFFNFVFPKVCLSFVEGKAKAIKIWAVFNGSNAIFILLMMLFLYLFPVEIVSYFNPKEVNKIVDLLKLALLIPILFALSNSMKQIVLALDKNREYVLTVVFVVIFSTIALFFIIPTYEVIGMIWVLIVTELVFLCLFAWLGLSNLKRKTRTVN